MSRPLLVTDCDEVLLHMVRHFSAWLDEEHAIDFSLNGNPFAESMRVRATGETVPEEKMWEYLGGFFDTQMDTQEPIAGALEAVAKIGEDADVVVLTNLTDERNAARVQQLRKHGLTAPVFTNQGPKGAALKRIVEEHGATRAVFIDDIAGHHKSALEKVPFVHRLHLCGEPAVAPHIPCAHEAGDAHARIDRWDEALPWILETLHR
ncbi:HAD family hydrolase [Erythrobacter sp. EC-HK427]|uniref:HAD family hydrolase n=1 Tax=Erythrobacter sp. EC-HK427 TaxID=2038396 RepID=UPI001258CC0B|nr:HAD family hydrolase [Erythrobacter sp. EC-HK427]VVT04867.1 conserved hypothetical protein [Erythrobacter sp. EC-HK427]